MDDEVVELQFFNPSNSATVILTFTPYLDSGQVNVNVSLRHPEGLSPLKAHRYSSMWFKWGGKCLKQGVGDDPTLPPLPSGWFPSDDQKGGENSNVISLH
jgi:hypothetical protein